MSTTTGSTITRKKLTHDEARKLTKLVAKAQAGSAKALEEARTILDKAGLWEYVGNLGHRVQELWLEAITGADTLGREGYERRADQLRRELLENGGSQLERLLVDRVVMTWLQVCHADMTYSSALRGEGHSFQMGKYFQERQDRANARHLKAVKALANVRRLLAPAVQVNIGCNQIISLGATGGQPEESHP